MNKRNKIIVSIVGITIVLLALLGITYGYYLTRIIGNTNSNSISLTTTNLQLTWIDGTDKLIDSPDVIVPGEFESSITFSVKNNGNAPIEDYGIALTDLRIKWATTVENRNEEAGVDTYLEYPEDFELKIGCSSDKTTCEGKDTYLPTTNEILLTNDIVEGETQTYTVTLKYVDSGIDQSADMNKYITARLDIIDTKNTTILTGVVSNYNPGDYVQTNSTPRISTIDKFGNYKIVGLEPGNHTVRLYDASKTAKGSKSISIEKEDSRIEVNIDRSTSTYKEGKITTNPYEVGTLAYYIINNAMNTSLVEESALGYAYFRETPLTTPGKQSTSSYEVIEPTSYSSKSVTTSNYYVYGDNIILDGYYHLVNPQVGKYSDIYNDLKGKYIFEQNGYSTEEDANEEMSKNNYRYAYKIGDNTNSTTIYYGQLKYKELGAKESTLSITDDNFTSITNIPSYYFRGNVKNNFVNYSGMCWRIVRIQGDGTVKLTLADPNYECDNPNYSTETKNIGGLSQNKPLELLDFIDKNHVSTSWCYDDSIYKINECPYENISECQWMALVNKYYNFYNREKLGNPSLKCDFFGINGTKSTLKSSEIGSLTADEAAYAGAAATINNSLYLKDNVADYYILNTPYVQYYGEDASFIILTDEGSYSEHYTHDITYSAIALEQDIIVKQGKGTQSDPYSLLIIKSANLEALAGMLYKEIKYISGMTWKDWANSDFSNGFERQGDKVIIGKVEDWDMCGTIDGNLDSEYANELVDYTYYINATSEEIITPNFHYEDINDIYLNDYFTNYDEICK